MPVEIQSFTTEVTLLDEQSNWSPAQMERLIQEVLRRVERQQRDTAQSRKTSSFGGTALTNRAT